jgi:hypothetical protein
MSAHPGRRLAAGAASGAAIAARRPLPPLTRALPARRKPRANFVPPRHGKFRHRLTPERGGGCSYNVPARAYENRQKVRFRREKCESKILVNGSIIARVKYKSQPVIAQVFAATASGWAPRGAFPLQNQRHRRRLRLPQGDLSYTYHNEGKETKYHELA